MNTTTEPLPDSDALAHSEKVKQHIRDIIAEQGAIPFSRYMQEVLYSPGLGYYAAGSRNFGTEGDFVTAPELSPLFAECISRQAQQILEQFQGDVLELGAGSGKLAVELIQALNQQGVLPDRYFILEPSADLRQRQQAYITEHAEHLAEHFVWLDALPTTFTGFIVGNEVLDAFPVERFVLENDHIYQITVDIDHGNLNESKQNAPEMLQRAVRQIESDLGTDLISGSVYEVNLLQAPWIQSLSDSLKAGAILLLDYGYPRREYYLPERTDGTLRCYYRHRAHHNPYLWPGLQDITAHVDFSALVAAAVDAGLEFEGFTSQAQFLLATELLDHADKQESDSMVVRSELARQIRQLTMPGAMGESFCAVGFSRGFDDLMLGFSGVELSHRL